MGVAVTALAVASAIQVSAAELYIGQGLVPVRNYQPIQGLSLQMPGEGAVPVAKGEFAVRLVASETSTICGGDRTREPVEFKSAPYTSTFVRDFTNEMGWNSQAYNNSGGLDGLIRRRAIFGRPARSGNGERDRLADTCHGMVRHCCKAVTALRPHRLVCPRKAWSAEGLYSRDRGRVAVKHQG